MDREIYSSCLHFNTHCIVTFNISFYIQILCLYQGFKMTLYKSEFIISATSDDKLENLHDQQLPTYNVMPANSQNQKQHQNDQKTVTNCTIIFPHTNTYLFSALLRTISLDRLACFLTILQRSFFLNFPF